MLYCRTQQVVPVSFENRFPFNMTSFFGPQALWRFRRWLICRWEGWGLMSCSLVMPTGCNCWISFLLQYSVVCTVAFLSMFYLIFISWFVCTRRWCIGKLEIFHVNKTSKVSWSTSELRVSLAPLNKLKPSLDFLWQFQCSASLWILFLLFLFHVCPDYTVVSVPCSFVITCWDRADLMALLCVLFPFPYGFSGRVWYFSVSIPDCLHLYFHGCL